MRKQEKEEEEEEEPGEGACRAVRERVGKGGGRQFVYASGNTESTGDLCFQSKDRPKRQQERANDVARSPSPSSSSWTARQANDTRQDTSHPIGLSTAAHSTPSDELPGSRSTTRW